MSQATTAYLTDKCEVRNRDVAGGHSVIAREVIYPGELIGVWSGRIVGPDELDTLPPEIRHHTVQVEEELYLASVHADEPPDFINHSCEPNAGLDGQIAIVAMQRILPGEEVTIDYAMCDGSPYDEFDCACGSAMCRGKMTGEDWRDPVLWERYAGHFSPYLQRRIDALRREQASRQPRRKRALALAASEAPGGVR
ncbi:MAG: SET domain-containing protein [Methyloceanibacter sp.]|uniref:SET domain-containing protein n=1 Tax=Methyloceanibacter sp. TaxID=1965321 RepID=UPI003D6C9B1F